MTHGNPVTAQTDFAYGPNGDRYRRIDRTGGSITATTRYIGKVEVIISAGGTETKRYLAGGAIVSTVNGGSATDRYALPDHLGSVDVVVNHSGSIVEASSFDAWGQRRNTANWQGAGAPLATTTHGFTGHEHVDGIGLIHMNGRIYDPAIGRFIQADSMIDAGTQGLNRYSYVLNNPLSLTDPSGHQSDWGYWMRAAITTAVAIGTGGIGGIEGFVMAGANGALAGAVESNSLKGAAWGAFSAVAFHGIGSYFNSAEWAQSGQQVFGTNLNAGGYSAAVLAHGVAGGVVQHLQGGQFGSGFAAAGIMQAASGAVNLIDPANPAVGRATRIMVSALIGGTVSDVTGGKFATGAVTGAFSQAFGESGYDHGMMSEAGSAQSDLSGVPSDEIRKLMTSDNPNDRVLAAQDAVDYFKIKGTGYTLHYSKLLKSGGLTNVDGSVFLGNSAYTSWSELGSTLGHEIEVHWESQYKPNGPYTSNQHRWMREVQAYDYNLKNASRFGNSTNEISSMKTLRANYYNNLIPANQQLIERGFYAPW